MAYIADDVDGPVPTLGIEAPPLRASRSEWRDVDDELPALHQGQGSFSNRVLARVREYDGSVRVTIDTYTGQRWEWSANGNRVTHWRPLPSPDLDP